MERDRHGLEHGGLFEREDFGETINNARGDGDKLGEGAGAAVVSARHAHDLAVIAEIDLSITAEGTHAAGDSGIECYTIAHAESNYLRAKSGNNPGSLMAHNEWRNTAA